MVSGTEPASRSRVHVHWGDLPASSASSQTALHFFLSSFCTTTQQTHTHRQASKEAKETGQRMTLRYFFLQDAAAKKSEKKEGKTVGENPKPAEQRESSSKKLRHVSFAVIVFLSAFEEFAHFLSREWEKNTTPISHFSLF